MPSGGKREGAGRKPTPAPLIRRTFRMTDQEWQQVQEDAKQEGLSTSEYIRYKLIGKKQARP